MKFTFLLISIIITIVFSGCSLKTAGVIVDAMAPKVKPQEVFSNKQVLVYDKTITLSKDSPITNAQFSSVDPDELAVSLGYKGDSTSVVSTNFAILDLKSGQIKKEIKFDEDKNQYSKSFHYSDDGKKLYIDNYLKRVPYTDCKAYEIDKYYINKKNTKNTSILKDKDDTNITELKVGDMMYVYEKRCIETTTLIHKFDFVVIDLNTQEVSYHTYDCENLIPPEHKGKAKCIKAQDVNLENFDENSLITSGYRYSENSSQAKNKIFKKGLVLYDKKNFQAKEIISSENYNLHTRFEGIDLNNMYALFVDSMFSNIVKSPNTYINYRIYDLKNKKNIYNLGNLFPEGASYLNYFLSKNQMLFRYKSGDIFDKERYAYIKILDLNTKETKKFDCTKYGCDVGKIHTLNSRYIAWYKFAAYDFYIFDTQKMEIVQQFSFKRFQRPRFVISKKYQKVAFIDDYKIYLYTISEKGDEKGVR